MPPVLRSYCPRLVLSRSTVIAVARSLSSSVIPTFAAHLQFLTGSSQRRRVDIITLQLCSISSLLRLHKGIACLLGILLSVGDHALIFMSARDAAGPTPLGPLPQAQRGCGVAAPRCRRTCRGVAVAIPPPLVSYGGLPVFVKECMPITARPRSRSCRRGVRGCSITTPFMWSPTTSGLGRPLGVSSKIVPQPLPRRVLRVTQRRCGSAGGAFGGFAAVPREGPRMFPRLKCSRLGAHRYCGCCDALTGARCCHCIAPRRRAPWPLAGNSNTLNSVDGHDSITLIP